MITLGFSLSFGVRNVCNNRLSKCQLVVMSAVNVLLSQQMTWLIAVANMVLPTFHLCVSNAMEVYNSLAYCHMTVRLLIIQIW